MLETIAYSMLRHGVTAFGAHLVKEGYVDADTAQALIGGGVAAAGLAWAAADKWVRRAF